jgi:hypothetical protein
MPKNPQSGQAVNQLGLEPSTAPHKTTINSDYFLMYDSTLNFLMETSSILYTVQLD